MLGLRSVSAGYAGDGRPVLDGVSLDVPGGAATGLLAPSGSGKTTLLRVAALLLAPWSGTVVVDGTEIRGTRFAVPPAIRRSIGYVVQSPRSSTNPRLTLRRIIAEPISFAAGLRTPKAEAHAERVAELADLVQLSPDLLDRLPHQVSDGQLQRACLARALAGEPRVLLCDEPTAMLDAPTTAVMMRVIERHVEGGAAALIASHDRALLEATCPVRHTLADLRAAA
jgi:peptide/nickel transport system ATP-binding protein